MRLRLGRTMRQVLDGPAAPPSGGNTALREDGTHALREDGSYALREG